MRFSGFDDEWKKSNLGNISSNEMYGMNSAAKDYDGFNKYIRITDISETSNKFIPNPLTSPDGDLEDKYKLKKGDIVFARTGASTGKTYLYDDNDRNLYFAGFLIKFHIDNADPKFIFYNTLKEEYLNWVSVMSVRSGQPGINSNEYKKLPIILPSLDEQNKISNFLTSIDKKIDLLERKHQFYQEFKKYLMQQIFTQKLRFENYNEAIYKLSDLYSSKKGTGLSKDKLDEEGLNKCILYGELYTTYNEIIQDVKSKTNSQEGILSKVGDILIPSSTTTKGIDLVTASVILEENVLLSGDITILRSKNENIINNKFFAYYFTNNLVKDVSKLTQGSTIIHLYWKDFKKVKLALPPINEQNKCVDLFLKLDKKIDLINFQIQKMEEFKKGLLQQMFVVRINWRCNFKLVKSPSFNKHLLILKNKIIFIIIK